jgi:hypothetical protein
MIGKWECRPDHRPFSSLPHPPLHPSASSAARLWPCRGFAAREPKLGERAVYPDHVHPQWLYVRGVDLTEMLRLWLSERTHLLPLIILYFGNCAPAVPSLPTRRPPASVDRKQWVVTIEVLENITIYYIYKSSLLQLKHPPNRASGAWQHLVAGRGCPCYCLSCTDPRYLSTRRRARRM